MPDGPLARASSSDKLGADEGIGMRLGIGHDLERERLQRIAGEHRHRLAELLVDGRLAAPHVVIVHARQSSWIRL